MRLINKHILALGRLSLIVFALANTGFTFVLYECTMSGAADVTACCDDLRTTIAGNCPEMGSPDPTEATLAANYPSCMVTTVVGGLQTDPKFVEKVSFTPQLTKIGFVPVTLSVLSNGPYLDRPFCLHSSVDTNISPPSVQKYVLTGAFLI